MSIEVVKYAEVIAAKKMDWSETDYRMVQESRIPHQVEVGPIPIRSGLAPKAVVTHVGAGLDMYKGGSSIRQGDPYGYGEELGYRMDSKNSSAGLRSPSGMPVGGNKILIDGDPEAFTFDDRLKLFTRLPEFLVAKNVLFNTFTAGDIGTNDPAFMDRYVQSRQAVAQKLGIDDKLWMAGATGTSEKFGGLPYRERATGYGVADNVRHARKVYERKYGISKPVMDVVAMGMGAVGAWALESLGKEEGYRIKGFSDKHGMLYIRDSRPGAPGIKIDETIVREVLDNPAFKDDPIYKGNKIQAMWDIIKRRQPNLDIVYAKPGEVDIVTFPTDIFIPAAGKDAINASNMRKIGSSIQSFGANGPESLEAYQYVSSEEFKAMREAEGRPLMQRPDQEANVRGVRTSMKEVHAKYAAAVDNKPIDHETNEIARREVEAEDQALYDKVDAMAELLDADEHVAIAAIDLTERAQYLGGITIDREIKELVTV